MKMNKKKLGIAVLSALAGMTFHTTSFAAQQDQDDAQPAGGLEEIQVTATRREQNLQEVPISIVAITGNNLEQRGIDNLEEVSQGVPNVLITGGGGGTGGTNFRMRGIPNVGTYIDNVWQVGTAGFLTNEFVDIDRVEVLRGPQGTMFGRDSTGGAVRIWTKRPAEEQGGSIGVTLGDYNRQDIKGTFDLPMGDSVRTKWTAATLTRDGYIKSLTTGESGGNVDQQVLRGDVVWDATDTISLRFNYQEDESIFTEPRVQDAMFRTYNDPNPNWVKIHVGLPEFYTYVGVDNKGNPVEPFFVPANQVAGYAGGKVGKWQNRSNITLPNRYDTDQASIELTWQLPNDMNLVFLTAQVKQAADSVIDWDNSQYDLVTDINRSILDMESNELQLTGSAFSIDWLVGLYSWDQTTKTRNGRWQVNEFQRGLLDVNRVLNSAACQNPPAGYQNCTQVYNTNVAGSYDVRSIAEQDGWAYFGEVSTTLFDKLDLTLGLRQHDQSGYSQNLAVNAQTAPKPLEPNRFHVGDAFAGTKTGVPNAFEFDKLTWRGVAQYQFTDEINAYLSYSEGFNSGGISAPVINGVRTEFPFKPSTLENTEVGVRSDLLDSTLRLNVTYFNTTWADLQAAGVVKDPVTGAQIPTLVTTNVGEAEAKGWELEATWVPTDQILLSLGWGKLSTSYTKIAAGTMAGHLPLTTGTEFAQAPDRSWTFGAQYTSNLAGGQLISRLDYNYQGQFWRSEPFLRVSGYSAVPDGYEESGDWGIMNMRFTYQPNSQPWEVAVFGTNITDEYTLNSGFFHGIWGFDFATVGRPREYGVSFNYTF
jgi:iron complex outermembrane receptor protein